MTPSELSAAHLVAVYGYGREGRALVRHVRDVAPGADLLVLLDGDADAATTRDGAALGFDVVAGTTAVGQVLDQLPLDVVLRSPGVSLHHGPLAAARARGVRVSTGTNLWFAEHEPDNVVAVTGTKGKSTTTALLAHLLRADGLDVAVGGNIGLPLLELPRPPSACDVVVVELSSFQLADLDARIPVGVWLNLHREHLDWHRTFDQYAVDKGRIATQSGVLVANARDPAVASAAEAHADAWWFDAGTDPVRLGTVSLPAHDLQAALDASRLVGTHQAVNLAAALTAALVLDVAPTRVLPTVASFEPLPHRLQLVHDDGRRWVDDSIATIPEATVAALRAFPTGPVTVIVGGFDRDQDHAPLVAELARRDDVTVVVMPDTGRRLASELGATGRSHVLVTDGLAEAVAAADAHTPAGGVVVLSPAAPSYGRFTSFEERGDRFAELARATGS